jgi:hypothetical protein
MGCHCGSGQRERQLLRDTGGFRIGEQLELGRAGRKERRRAPQRRTFQR